MEQQTSYKFWKEDGILLSCLFNLYAEYIMRSAGLDEAQAGIKIARRNINNLRGNASSITFLKTSTCKYLEILK